MRSSGVSGRSTGFDLRLTTTGSDKSPKLRLESDAVLHSCVVDGRVDGGPVVAQWDGKQLVFHGRRFLARCHAFLYYRLGTLLMGSMLLVGSLCYYWQKKTRRSGWKGGREGGRYGGGVGDLECEHYRLSRQRAFASWEYARAV